MTALPTPRVSAPRMAAGPLAAGRIPSIPWVPLARRFGQALVLLPPSTWMLLDITIVGLGACLAFLIFPPPTLEATPHIASWQALAVFAFSVTVASLVFGLYERETIMSRSRIATRMLLTLAASVAVAYAIIYVVMYSTVSRRVTGFTFAFLLLGGGGARFLAGWAAHTVARGLLVVGARSLYESFVSARKQGLLGEYRLAGYALPDDSDADPDQPAFRGSIRNRAAALRAEGITDVVVSADAACDPGVMEWMVPCLQQGCRVTNEAIFYEKATGQILVDQITPAWFLFADLKVHCDQRATFKRVGDILVSIVGLALTLPLWVIIALAIRLCDRGPVFYSQERVGQNGRPFTLLKFRTMRTDAENGRSVWAAPNDPRVTTVGRWLRRTRLDELPQLCNVLVGDMSLVGPRPERPDLVAELAGKLPFYNERHLVKPGITGWAQISFRYGASLADARQKLQFDLYYLKHMSLELDLIILFRTLGTFLRGAC
jgi:sugar transferase (PEP-CTERM system associated)